MVIFFILLLHFQTLCLCLSLYSCHSERPRAQRLIVAIVQLWFTKPTILYSHLAHHSTNSCLLLRIYMYFLHTRTCEQTRSNSRIPQTIYVLSLNLVVQTRTITSREQWPSADNLYNCALYKYRQEYRKKLWFRSIVRVYRDPEYREIVIFRNYKKKYRNKNNLNFDNRTREYFRKESPVTCKNKYKTLRILWFAEK